MRWIAFLLALLSTLAGPAAAQTAPPATATPGHVLPNTAAELDRLATVLKDPVRREELLRLLEALAAADRALHPPDRPAAAATAPATAAPATAAPPATTPATPAVTADANALFTPTTLGGRMLVGLGERIQQFSDLVVETTRSMADLPALWAGMEALWEQPEQRARLSDALFCLLTLGGPALALELIIFGLLRRFSRRLDRLAPPDGDVWTWLRRVPLVLGRLGLDIAPLFALVFAATVLLGAARPAQASAIVVLMAVHTYAAARVALAVARMLLSPASNHLRLLPVPDPVAAYLIIWWRRITLVALGGYAMAEAGQVIGLPLPVYGALIRLSLLIVTLMLVRMIRQQRHNVATLLRPAALTADDAEIPTDAATRRLLNGLRSRVAEHWHMLAMVWLGASWMVWAVGVEHGFARMVRASALTLLVVAAARLLDEAMRRLLRLLRHPSPALAQYAPWLERLARTYVPPIRMGWTLLLLATSLVLVAQAWGYGTFAWFQPGQPGHKLLGTLLSIGFTVGLALVVWEAANGAIERHLSRAAPPGARQVSATRLRTLLPVLRAFIAFGVFAFIVVNVLQEMGVNIGPLVAGAGVIGLAVGFGSQKLVQDVITGMFLLFEDSVSVGDVVSLGDRTGVVEHLTIRSIKLRALDGSIHWVPFSAVTTVTNMTRDFGYAVVDVTVGWQESPDKVIATLRRIGQDMAADPAWAERLDGQIEAAAMEKMTDMGMVFRIRARTAPGDRWMVARELNRRCRVELEKSGIEMPPPAQRLNVELPDQAQLLNAAPPMR